MKTLLRWGKFNLVGAVGVLVQLGVLALLDRFAPRHYLLNTAAAIELTLAHNFAWHERFTWQDRAGTSRRIEALLRFQLSNGLVSLAGNLFLMRMLVQSARLPVLAANGIAILACSLINFGLGDRWVFAGGERD